MDEIMEQRGENGDVAAAAAAARKEGEQAALIDVESGGMNTKRLRLLGSLGAVGGDCHDDDDHHPQKQKQAGVYANSLSSREMESLTALCDAFLPSVNHQRDGAADEEHSPVATFYRSSASMAGTPQRLGGLISERLKHPKKWMIRLALWLLSTWVGTFIFCGVASITSKFPYFQSFSRISQQQKEEILLAWSLSFIHPLRMLFKAVKLLSLFVYFSQVDDKNENLTWEAIGYPGPDPQFRAQTRLQPKLSQTPSPNRNRRANGGDEDTEEQELLFGPLYRGLVNMNLPSDMVADSLRRFGFSISMGRKEKANAGNGSSSSSSCPSLVIQCDAVVVGSGSGGGVVAGVLAKAGYKVLVLEKGNYFARENLPLLEGVAMDQMYLSGGILATDDMGAVILAGSTVGGGSTVNWSASIRTPQHVVHEWSSPHGYGLELFGSKLYREALDAVCKKMGVQSEIDEEGFNNAVLRRGCEELGYPVLDIPRNSGPDHYCGWCCLGCKDGRKKGTCETWLLDMVNSGNGVILPGCAAVRVLRKRNKRNCRDTATGVAFEFERLKGVKNLWVVECKVTIVACGALSTPVLLKASGLKNANIGKNLHLHPVTMAWGYFPESRWPDKGKKSYEGGIMTAMSTVNVDLDDEGRTAGGYRYGAVIQTPALHPGMFSAVMPWVSGADMKRRMCRFSRTAHIFALARDRGSGTVNSPSSISYRMDPGDEENLQKGLEKILRILAAAGAEEIGTQHCKGKTINVKKVSYREFEGFVKEESARPLRDLSAQICSAHQMGSCRMGLNPKESVVNQMGETWEVEGLFLADSSVFPTALGVNPMVTVQAIAYCTALSVLQLLSRKSSMCL